MNYQLVSKELASLIQDDQKVVSVLSNASALLNQELTDVNWVGFYLLEDELYVGPFQGKVACSPLPKGIGVCWKAVETQSVVVVDDVHQFSGHIACDSASLSEIVCPIVIKNQVFGVLDIDSPRYNRFTKEDGEGFKLIIQVISQKIESLM